MTSIETDPVRLKKRTPAQAEAIVHAAEIYAIKQHSGGDGHGDREYRWHLDETVEVEWRFGGKHPAVIAASWCHDVLEDCMLGIPMSERRDQLAAIIGDDAEAIVWAVTDREGYPNRAARKAATLPFTRVQSGATDVKLSDRIANIEQALRSGNSSMLKMYLKEHESFEQHLRVEGVCEAKWRHLRSLLLLSDAPAGEGDFTPSGARRYFDGNELLAMSRRCAKGDVDELLMFAPGVIFARIGNVIFEQSVTSSAKTSRNAMQRPDEENAKVEFARMLPARIERWFRPVRVAISEGEEGGVPDGDARTIDELLDGADDLLRELRRIAGVVGPGQYREDLPGGGRLYYSDNHSRDGAREGVRRWARQHPRRVAHTDVRSQITSILGSGW